jgi:hypothetical protein
MKTALAIIGSVIGFILLMFIMSEVGLIHYQFFAPKYENARRKTFEQTQSYVQGKIQDLSNYKLQIDTTKDLTNKAAIKAVVRSQFASFNIDDCPDELKPFLIATRGY